LIECLVALAAERAIESAHDLSDGGFAVALAESCFASDGLSAEVALESEHPPEFTLFGETGARAIVTARHGSLARVLQIAAQYKVSARPIGKVTRADFSIQLNGESGIRSGVDSLRQIWTSSLERALRNT
jgi:phosphoribosylformylglycinamidine synthase subunit PurL